MAENIHMVTRGMNDFPSGTTRRHIHRPRPAMCRPYPRLVRARGCHYQAGATTPARGQDCRRRDLPGSAAMIHPGPIARWLDSDTEIDRLRVPGCALGRARV